MGGDNGLTLMTKQGQVAKPAGAFSTRAPRSHFTSQLWTICCCPVCAKGNDGTALPGTWLVLTPKQRALLSAVPRLPLPVWPPVPSPP